MNIATFFKKHCFGIAICQGKQEIFDVPNQITKKSFWGIMFFETDKHHPATSFLQQQILPKK